MLTHRRTRPDAAHAVGMVAFLCSAGVCLLAAAGTAAAQNTRSSGDPLLDIAAGLDPLTGQPASVPFTAPTTFAGTQGLPQTQPGSVQPAPAQQIFISDQQLAQPGGQVAQTRLTQTQVTQIRTVQPQAFVGQGQVGFAQGIPSGFSAPGAVVAPTGVVGQTTTVTSGAFGTPGANAGIGFVDTSGATTQFFVSDAELAAASNGGIVSSTTTTIGGGFRPTDAIVGRLPGNLPVVGPEFQNELPGMGLSVVQPIQSVSAQRADQLAAGVLDTPMSFGSGFGTETVAAAVPANLPTPAARGTRRLPYVSGNLAACRQGYASCQTRRGNIADPQPVSSVTPPQDTDNLNAPIVDGTPATFTVLPQANQGNAVPTPQPDIARGDVPRPQNLTAGQSTQTPSATAPAASGTCGGATVVQFSGEANDLDDAQKRQLRGLLTACSGRPNTVYTVVAYPAPEWAGTPAERQIPGARLFAVRFELVAAGISASNLDLSTEQDTSRFSNALVISVE